MKLLLNIFSLFRRRPWLALLSFVLLTAVAAVSVARLSFKEDIADFLPLDENHRTALRVYQDIAGANRIIAVFAQKDSATADADVMVAAIDRFTALVEERDTASMVGNVVSRIDMEKMTELSGFVYDNIPYFLTASDYRRIDSLWATPDFVRSRLQADKQMLLFPTGGMLQENIGRDPLNLFTPVVEQLNRSAASARYELYDGCIFTPDMTRAVVLLDSRYGSVETENNARLVRLLNDCAHAVSAEQPAIDVHLVGGPVIAVGNSSQIKTDSLISVSLSVVLILLLLFLTLRSVRNLLLIALSIAWGWLFALGALSMIHSDVSMIVVGISSVILGIAVNYPLHFIAHLGHTPDRRLALREIVAPLVVGNITTIGAFLALVPLQSVALRDLGLFASFLLLGTILFVLIYLPHVSKVSHHAAPRFLARLADFAPENKPWIVGVVALLTIFFAFFATRTGFDTDMSHINYLDEAQKADLNYFSRMMTTEGDGEKVYALSSDSTLDGALTKSRQLRTTIQGLKTSGTVSDVSGCYRFVPDRAEQVARLGLWREFVAKHKTAIRERLTAAATQEGFAEGSFTEFFDLLEKDYSPQSPEYFSPLIRTSFASYISSDSINHLYNVVDVLTTTADKAQQVEDALDRAGSYGFDVKSMNSSIADRLSDDFNYIGWACGCIVFFFLWLSLGSLELALLSFVPMAVSWIWILGIMGLGGVDFNIVNIILATFIFGQGDDYTIFMTEGACYEYAYRRRMLSSYKVSIILSALIMFIGIGTLILAKHPALFSLAEVTIAGMFSVVLMAYLFPPLIFKYLVQTKGNYRTRPLTLARLLCMAVGTTVFLLEMWVGYVIGWLYLEMLPASEKRRLRFRRFVRRTFAVNFRLLPGVKVKVNNQYGETFNRPVVVVCNHQSLLDPVLLMTLSERLIFVTNAHVGRNKIIRRMYQWLENVPLGEDEERMPDIEHLQSLMQRGYSLVVFPEGQRNDESSVLRFHKGAFYMAERLGADIVPILLHGVNGIVPTGSPAACSGTITLSVKERITAADKVWGEDYVARTKNIHVYFVREYAQMKRANETTAYYLPLVRDRYRYKGVEIERAVGRSLKRYAAKVKLIDEVPAAAQYIVWGNDYGAFALTLSLVHAEANVIYVCDEGDMALVARYSAEGIAPRMRAVASSEWKMPTATDAENTHIFLLSASDEEKGKWKNYSVTLVN